MKIPFWISNTGFGIFTCLFCGGLVVQTLQGFICTKNHCEKHEHTHTEVVSFNNLGTGPYMSASSVSTSGMTTTT